jgi:uncharacterized protein
MGETRMNRYRALAIAVFIAVAMGLSLAQQAADARKEAVLAAGKEFVELLGKAEYAKGVALFDSTMTAVMPEAKLKEAWEAVTAQTGPLKSIIGVKAGKYQVYDIVVATCQCERKTFDTRVVFDAKGKIAGLFFAEASAEYKAPLYVDRSSFKEEDAFVGTGEWALHATLSVPDGNGPFPALVLVHGSGPNDRDETIGPNKPFRDLAWGLASKGIVVLRYEKRTKEHASKLVGLKNTLTVKEETVDDALAAVSLLRRTSKVDSKRIYVLGHSLGGMLLPRIGKLDAGIAGLVSLAGAARPLEDLILEQMTYIIGLKGTLSDADKKQLDDIAKQVEHIKSLKESDANSSESVFSAPPMYWLDLRGYDPPAVASSLTQPMLVMQGERDYQVTMKDFERWKAALGGRKNVEFKAYPKLNHLFIEGEGKSVPAEYNNAGHIPGYVIDEIAGWIKK